MDRQRVAKELVKLARGLEGSDREEDWKAFNRLNGRIGELVAELRSCRTALRNEARNLDGVTVEELTSEGAREFRQAFRDAGKKLLEAQEAVLRVTEAASAEMGRLEDASGDEWKQWN